MLSENAKGLKLRVGFSGDGGLEKESKILKAVSYSLCNEFPQVN